MKKAVFLITMLCALAFPSMAEKTTTTLRFHRHGNHQLSQEVNRAPARIPAIEVYYDSETQTIEVVGDEYVEAEVFLYDEEGNVVDYSSTLNAIFSVSAPGSYRILIQSANWYAEGEICVL